MKETDSKGRILSILFVLFLLLLTFGTIGFMLLKGYTLWEAFYQTIIILATHFYHEIKEPLSIQILVLGLIFGSLVIVVYVIKFFAEFVFEGTFKEARRKRYMKNKINSFVGHYIICGYGRVGKQIAEELKDEGVDFVVIDRDAAEAKEAVDKGYLSINADPTREESLLSAGVLKAKAVLVVTGSDVDNLYVVLSARSLNPDAYIVSRAAREESISKLKKAGADRVAMPEQIGGYHMATMALRPTVIDFLDVIVDGKHDELTVEEVTIAPDSQFVRKSLSDYLDKKTGDVSILAISRSDGSTKINPKGDEILGINDKLILMGAKKQVEKMGVER